MATEDRDARHLHKRQESLELPVVYHEGSKGLKSRGEWFDLPAAGGGAELATFVRDIPPRRTVQGDERDTTLREFGIQGVAVVVVARDDSSATPAKNPTILRVVNER